MVFMVVGDIVSVLNRDFQAGTYKFSGRFMRLGVRCRFAGMHVGCKMGVSHR